MRHSLAPHLLSLGLFSASLAAAAPVETEHVTADLVAETNTIHPGQPFTVGLRLQLEEHWHVYWTNPGDTGLAPTIDWTLPEGFTAGEIEWPHPQLIPTPPFMTYGYEGELLLMVKLTPPADLAPGSMVTLGARAGWLVCDDVCMPGNSEHTLELRVSNDSPQPNAELAPLFSKTRQELPVAVEESWPASFELSENHFELTIKPPPGTRVDAESVYFFPFEESVIEPAQPQEVTFADGIFSIRMVRSEYNEEVPATLGGVLVANSGFPPILAGRSIALTAQPASATPGGVVASMSASTVDTDANTTFISAAILAFIGGLILNLMPCVFPVLSIKIVSFVQQAGGDRGKTLKHGLVFAAGVLVSFWVLAGLLLALRAGGSHIGWGFQLQSPTVVMVIGAVLFVMALSLFGVFEIGGSMISLASKGGGEGYSGSFGTGVLATIVATPCTAPFMGTALTFAFNQSPVVSLSVFTALGIGMATPYVVLSANPQLLKLLPRPGAWMETFKQAMAFPLLATLIWLTWVLSLQVGPDGMVQFLGALLMLAVASWIFGRWNTPVRSATVRNVARFITLVAVAGGVWFAAKARNSEVPSATTNAAHGEGIPWEKFSSAKLDDLRSAGKPVFIDFTAAWCITCKVNEFRTFRSDDVRDALEANGVTPLVADWTNYDAEITAALDRFGRQSVPLYVYYAPGKDAEPQILPQLLTPEHVLEVVDKQ